MTREEAIYILRNTAWLAPSLEPVDEAIEMATEALKKTDSSLSKWIPIKWHYITDEECKENGYPKDWVYLLDCEMPDDEQEILVTTNHGRVEKDVCYIDDGFSLDSGWDWCDDIVAWMPLPEPYKGGAE